MLRRTRAWKLAHVLSAARSPARGRAMPTRQHPPHHARATSVRRFVAAFSVAMSSLTACAVMLAALSTAAFAALPGKGEHLNARGGYEIRRWSVRDGLPQDSVTALALDRDGCLWVGTYAGLARFDGARFERFGVQNTEALCSNRVTALEATPAGDVWIAAQDGDVAVWHAGRFESWPDDELAPRESIRAIVCAADGSVWFGGRDLTRRKDGRFDEVVPRFPGDAIVVSICELQGELWLGTTRGVFRYGADGLRRAEIAPIEGTLLGVLANDAGELVWATVDGGLATWNGRAFVPASGFELRARVQGSSVTRPGRAWLATRGGLRALEIGEDTSAGLELELGDPVDLGVSEPNVRCVLAASDDVAWVGLVKGGLLRVARREFRRWSTPSQAAGARAFSLDRRGALWARFDQWRPWIDGSPLGLESGVPADLIGPADALISSSDGTMWFALGRDGFRLAGGELERFDPCVEPTVTSLFEDRARRLWIGGYGGVACRENGVTRALPVTRGAPPSGPVRVLGESSDGSVWFGGDGLLLRAARAESSNSNVTTLERCVGVPRGEVRSMAELESGALWFSSYGGGLFRRGARARDGTFAFERITSDHGLPDDGLGGLLAVGDDLWVNSNAGVFRVRGAELAACIERPDRRGAGLTCRIVDTGECNGAAACRLPDGRLCFPTVDGVVEIDPSGQFEPLKPPRPRIDALVADDVVRGSRERLELPPLDRRLELSFTGVQLDDGDGVRFRYQLEGYDDRWVDAGAERRAVYTRLAPGDYTFRVTARSRDGVWNEHPATLAFTIAPRWHERAWVRAAFVLAALGALGTSVARRLRHASARTLELTREIAERERIERELRASRETYRVVAESATDAIVTVDARGCVVYANPAASSVFGVDASELLGTPLSARMPALFGDDARDGSAEAAGTPASITSSGARARHETHVERVDGSRVPVEVSLASHGGPDDAPQVTSIVRDVSERHAAERERAQLLEQLTALNSGLELRIKERTRELEVALSDLEAFTYSVSHDLRAPVRHIASFASIVAEDYGELLPSEGKERLAVVQHSASRLGTLIDDLLLLSGLGRCALRPVWIDHENLVDGLWRELAASGHTGNAELVRAHLPRSRGDEGLLRQVWINLLDNAIKYSSKHPRPRIEVASFWENGRDWYRVRDNGVGFDPEQKGLLFGVFTRLHAEHEFPGTGVGLAIVKRVLERHGGEVRADGRVGAGAVFEFTLGERVAAGRAARRERGTALASEIVEA